MKTFLILTLILVALTVESNGQGNPPSSYPDPPRPKRHPAKAAPSPTPPPPPLTIKGDGNYPTSKAPIEFRGPIAGTTPFESKEGAFKVSFPGPPTISEVPSETGSGQGIIKLHALKTALAEYAVWYMEFPATISDRDELDVLFDSIRDAWARTLSGRVLEDSQLEFGDHFGRQVTIGSAKTTGFLRTLAVGPRLYIMSVVLLGSAKISNEVRPKLVQDFFDSFQITRVVEAKYKAVEIPEDVGLVIRGNELSSSFFGLSMRPPSGWALASSEEAAWVMQIGEELLEGTKLGKAAAAASKGSRTLALYTRSPLTASATDGLLFVLAVRASYPSFSPLSAAKEYEHDGLPDGHTIISKPRTTTLGGKEFGWVESTDGRLKVTSRAYFGNIRGISIQFVLVFRNNAARDEMLAALATVKFSDPPTSK